jgi:hypothetical protein
MRAKAGRVGADQALLSFPGTIPDASPEFAYSRLSGVGFGVFHRRGPRRGGCRRHQRRGSLLVGACIAGANSAGWRVLGAERPGRPRLLSVRRWGRGRPDHQPSDPAPSSPRRYCRAPAGSKSQSSRHSVGARGRRRRVPRFARCRRPGVAGFNWRRRRAWAWRGHGSAYRRASVTKFGRRACVWRRRGSAYRLACLPRCCGRWGRGSAHRRASDTKSGGRARARRRRSSPHRRPRLTRSCGWRGSRGRRGRRRWRYRTSLSDLAVWNTAGVSAALDIDRAVSTFCQDRDVHRPPVALLRTAGRDVFIPKKTQISGASPGSRIPSLTCGPMPWRLSGPPRKHRGGTWRPRRGPYPRPRGPSIPR